MNMNNKTKLMKLKFILCGLFLFVLLSSVVYAAYGVPHQFKGRVTINGNTAPDGLLVVAKINGVSVAATSTRDGNYGYSPTIFYVPDPDSNRDGNKIEFFVDGIKAADYTFSNGASTKLDLAVSGNFNNNPPSNSGGGGGSGGSGGATNSNTTSNNNSIIVVTSNTANPSNKCVPDWVCSDWLDCVNGMQKRICVDANRCGTNDNRPAEKQDCKLSDKVEEQRKEITNEDQKSFFNKITGAIVGGGSASVISLIVLIVIIVGILLFVFFRRRGRAKEENQDNSQ